MIAYHDYQGVVVDRNERKSLAEDMGDKNIVFLRNHGVITAGSSIGAAWYLMYQLLAATDIQSHASACALGDAENLNMPSDSTVNKTYEVMHKKGFSGAAYGLKELSAYMRLLDKLDDSYRT
jgi:adducin